MAFRNETCGSKGFVRVNLKELLCLKQSRLSSVFRGVGTEQCSLTGGDETIRSKTVSMLQSIEKLDVASGTSIDSRTMVSLYTLTASGQQTETTPSFAIPDGLVMDPLAPTALAVSSEFMERIGSSLTLLRDHGKKLQKYICKNRNPESVNKSWRSIVNVVLIEAKDLPDGTGNGPNCVYCKFKLGSESQKSKQVAKSKATWCEQFNLHMYDDSNLEVTVWHKGKQKNFMGRCTIDLSMLEREKTHELWQELECGYGTLHLLVTLSATARVFPLDNVPSTLGVKHVPPVEEDFSWYRLDKDWSEVGRLTVTVHGARGLSNLSIGGKTDAFCILELDNSRVQTHTVKGTSEPTWNKCYNFAVNDITSTVDITVCDESLINSLHYDILGKISIPLLRINNDEKRWYALKDRSKKSGARGNCPRILLQMTVAYNPIKASLRVLSPKENKYSVKKSQKFDIPLIYNNVLFVKKIFDSIVVVNEHIKIVFEWDNREKSAITLIVWLAFLHFFRLWMLPLLIIVPFIYNWTGYRSCNHSSFVAVYDEDDDLLEDDESHKDDKTIRTRLYSLQELTFTIKGGIDYLVSLIERLKNLGNFTVPYLSYLAICALLAAAVALYVIPTSYLFMALGIYKFTRKFLNPSRVPNNDLLDFLSRVPDDKILKQWRELKVPEPNMVRTNSLRKR